MLQILKENTEHTWSVKSEVYWLVSV